LCEQPEPDAPGASAASGASPLGGL
jgi:hypothetical protein